MPSASWTRLMKTPLAIDYTFKETICKEKHREFISVVHKKTQEDRVLQII